MYKILSHGKPAIYLQIFQEVHHLEVNRRFMESLRIVLMGKNFELRLVSLVVRARELAEEVVIIDLGSEDDTIKMANKVDVRVINHEKDIVVPTICKALQKDEPADYTLLVYVTSSFQTKRYATSGKSGQRKLGRTHVLY